MKLGPLAIAVASTAVATTAAATVVLSIGQSDGEKYKIKYGLLFEKFSLIGLVGEAEVENLAGILFTYQKSVAFHLVNNSII